MKSQALLTQVIVIFFIISLQKRNNILLLISVHQCLILKKFKSLGLLSH